MNVVREGYLLCVTCIVKRPYIGKCKKEVRRINLIVSVCVYVHCFKLNEKTNIKMRVGYLLK